MKSYIDELMKTGGHILSPESKKEKSYIDELIEKGDHILSSEPEKEKSYIDELIEKRSEIDKTIAPETNPIIPTIKSPIEPTKGFSPSMLDKYGYGQPEKQQERFDTPIIDQSPKIVTAQDKIRNLGQKMSSAKLKETLNKTKWVMPESGPLTEKESKYLDIKIKELATEYGLTKSDNMLDIAGKGLAVGLKQTGQALSTYAEIAGILTNKKGLEIWGKAFADQFQEEIDNLGPNDKRLLMNPLDNPKNLVNPLWYAYNVSQILPSLVVSMGTAAAGEKITASMLPKLLKKITPTKIIKLSQIGGMLTGGLAGGGLEGAATYRTMRGLGADKKTAIIGSTFMGLASSGLNAISLDGLYRYLGRGTLSQLALSSATEAITEWLEEPVEATILTSSKLQSAKEAFGNAIKSGAQIIPASLATSFLTFGIAGAMNWKPTNTKEESIKKEVIDFASKNTVNAVTGEKIDVSTDMTTTKELNEVDLNDNEPQFGLSTEELTELKLNDNEPQFGILDEFVGDALTTETEEDIIKENDRIILKDLSTKMKNETDIKEHKGLFGRVSNAFDIVYNDIIVKKFMGAFDTYYFGWSSRYSLKQKRLMEAVFKAFKNSAYSIQVNANAKWSEVFNYFGDDKKLMSDFLLYMETPDKYPIKDQNVKQKFDKFRNTMLEYDEEAKKLLQKQVDDIIESVEKKQGFEFKEEEKEKILNELNYYTIFPNSNTNKRYIDNIMEDRKELAIIDAKLANPNISTIEEIEIKDKATMIKEHIRHTEKILQHIQNNKVRYMPMAFKPSAGKIKKGTKIGASYKRVWEVVSEIEREDVGRRNLWEFFDDLPPTIQALYFTNPAEQLAYYWLHSGIRYVERSLIKNCLEADAGIFLSEEEYQILPDMKKREYGKMNKHLLAEHGYLKGLYVSNAFETFFYDNLDKIANSKIPPIIKLFSLINKIIAPLGDLMIMNPLIMAKLNFQQTNLVSPIANLYVAQVGLMRIQNPKKFSKFSAMSLAIGMNTAEISVNDMGRYGQEYRIDKIKEEAKLKSIEKFFLRGVPASFTNKPLALKVMTSIFSTSRTIAFELFDTNTKVGITKWLYKKTSDMKKNNPKEFNKLLEGTENIDLIIPDRLNYSDEDIEILKVMALYNQKYGISEVIGEYGRTPWSTRQIINAFGRYYQLRISFYASLRKIVQSAIEFEETETERREFKSIHINNIAAQRLILMLTFNALDALFPFLAGYYIKDGYKKVKRNLNNDTTFYIVSGLQSVLKGYATYEEFDKKLEKEYGWFYNLGYRIGSVLHLFSKERAYDAAIKKLQKESGNLQSVMIGRELFNVPSDPVSFIPKLFSKGWKGFAPMMAPPLAITNDFLLTDDIGVFWKGEYIPLANRNSSPVERFSASLLKYCNEMTGIGSVINTLSAKDVPQWMKIIQASTGYFYSYNKKGKPITTIMTAKEKLSVHPLIIQAYVCDHAGKRRETDDQKTYVDILLFAYVLRDKVLGVGMKNYYEVVKQTILDFKIFGEDEAFNRKELEYLENSMDEATIAGEYLKIKELFNAFESVRDKYKLEGIEDPTENEQILNEGTKKIKEILDDYLKNYENFSIPIAQVTKDMARKIFTDLWKEFETPTQEEYNKILESKNAEDY